MSFPVEASCQLSGKPFGMSLLNLARDHPAVSLILLESSVAFWDLGQGCLWLPDRGDGKTDG